MSDGTRMTELEERQMFFERDIEELSRVVAEQQAELERLSAELATLRARVVAAHGEEGEESRSLEDDRPPHY